MSTGSPDYLDLFTHTEEETGDNINWIYWLTSFHQLLEDINKRPIGLDALLENQLGHLPKFQKLHIYSISNSGVEIELIFPLWASVSEIHDDFQNFHIWAWNSFIGQSSRGRTCTLFLPQQVKIELIFALRAVVSEIWADFKKCHIWAWNLAIGQSTRSCSYTLFLPLGVKIELILALWAAVSKIQADFQNCLIWAWNMAIGQSARSHTYTIVRPQGVETEPIFALRAAISEIWGDFQNCHIWAWNLAGQSSRCCTYTLFLPQGVEIELIFALQAAVSKIRTNFQNCHIWAWNLASGQSSRSCTYITSDNLNYSGVPNFILFCSTVAHFPDNWGFWFLHRVKWWILNWKKIINNRKLKILKIPRSFVRTIGKKIQEKFERFRLRFVGGVAFWNFGSHRVPC